MELLMPWFNYGRIFHSINAETLVKSTSFYTLEQASALHRVTSNGGVAFDAPSDRPLCKNPWTIVFLVSYRVSSPPFFLCFCLLNVLSTFYTCFSSLMTECGHDGSLELSVFAAGLVPWPGLLGRCLQTVPLRAPPFLLAGERAIPACPRRYSGREACY